MSNVKPYPIMHIPGETRTSIVVRLSFRDKQTREAAAKSGNSMMNTLDNDALIQILYLSDELTKAQRTIVQLRMKVKEAHRRTKALDSELRAQEEAY